jgi:hypothetical protein
MNEAELRAEFSGRHMQGYYHNGNTWIASYVADGQLEYRHNSEAADGNWSVRGSIFCVFYQLASRGAYPSGGCLKVIRRGSNCYEYYRATRLGDDEVSIDLPPVWHSRGWRSGEPPTCELRPTV